jgi:hypothetical protein
MKEESLEVVIKACREMIRVFSTEQSGAYRTEYAALADREQALREVLRIDEQFKVAELLQRSITKTRAEELQLHEKLGAARRAGNAQGDRSRALEATDAFGHWKYGFLGSLEFIGPIRIQQTEAKVEIGIGEEWFDELDYPTPDELLQALVNIKTRLESDAEQLSTYILDALQAAEARGDRGIKFKELKQSVETMRHKKLEKWQRGGLLFAISQLIDAGKIGFSTPMLVEQRESISLVPSWPEPNPGVFRRAHKFELLRRREA